MSRIAIELEIVLVALLAVAISASSVPQQVGTPLKDVGDLLIGRWAGEGIYAADYPGKSVEFNDASRSPKPAQC